MQQLPSTSVLGSWALGFYSSLRNGNDISNNPRYSSYLPFYHTSFIGVQLSLLVLGLRFPGDKTIWGAGINVSAPHVNRDISPFSDLGWDLANWIWVLFLGTTPRSRGDTVSVHQETTIAFGNGNPRFGWPSAAPQLSRSAANHCYAVVPTVSLFYIVCKNQNFSLLSSITVLCSTP